MNKKQALAAMDARLTAISVERQLRLQKRQQSMLRLYPFLKHAPPEDRPGLLQEAARYAFRQWTVYATLGLFIAVAIYLVRQQVLGLSTGISALSLLLLIALAAAPAVTLYTQIRGYLRLLVGAKYEVDHESAIRRAD
jgi:hypothetical protein